MEFPSCLRCRRLLSEMVCHRFGSLIWWDIPYGTDGRVRYGTTSILSRMNSRVYSDPSQLIFDLRRRLWKRGHPSSEGDPYGELLQFLTQAVARIWPERPCLDVKRGSVPRAMLESALQRVNEGSSIAAEAHFLGIGHEALKRAWRDDGFELPEVRRGRPRRPDATAEEFGVICEVATRANVGYKGAASIAGVSEIVARRVFAEEELWQMGWEERQLELHDLRWEAVCVSQIFHTDLHDSRALGGRKAIAFIDAYSRFVPYFALMEGNRKTAEEAARHLRLFLDQLIASGRPAPAMIFGDNGSEFKGAFLRLLIEREICYASCRPRTPQQNGKMEVWWKVFERRAAGGLPWEEVVDLYNATAHSGLRAMLERRELHWGAVTPAEAWGNPEWRYLGPGTVEGLFDVYYPEDSIQVVRHFLSEFCEDV
jgi:transposase InsO family protein